MNPKHACKTKYSFIITTGLKSLTRIVNNEEPLGPTSGVQLQASLPQPLRFCKPTVSLSRRANKDGVI